ncbi:MAG TPA: hypoxanthine phosphoribosyltransferase [Nanoarchaeota archaeon]|nr:hypoxanthine phosphoribosyltransferase [Nanoarchaeota archaeon]
MAEKRFITADELQLDSYRLAKQICDSGFQPDFMIALWRGGTPVGCYVQEFLKQKGLKVDHIATRTSRYTGIEKAEETVRIHGLDYIIKKINNTDRLLIVDDVFDSGKTIAALIEKLKLKARANTPSEIKVATVFYKPKNNKTRIKPDFYIHETDKWLVFPHELEGLTPEEIATGKGKEIAGLLE